MADKLDEVLAAFRALSVADQHAFREAIKRKRGRERVPERTNYFWLKWDAWIFIAKLREAKMPPDEALAIAVENYKPQGLTKSAVQAIFSNKDRQIQDAIKFGI